MPGLADATALAHFACTICGGRGMVKRWNRPERWCACAYRRIFRACLRRYRYCQEFPDPRAYIALVAGRLTTGFRRAEYSADFTLAGERCLAGLDLQIFRLRFLREVEESGCVGRLAIDAGKFWHRVYRIEGILGKAMYDGGLFPGEYFSARYLDAVPTGKPLKPPGFGEGEQRMHVGTKRRPSLRQPGPMRGGHLLFRKET